jgi:hypothetical protein
MSEEREDQSSSRKFSAAVAILLAVPLLYVLSVGPVEAVSQKIPSSRGAVRQFYAPVIWLRNNTTLQKPLDLYVGLWGVH